MKVTDSKRNQWYIIYTYNSPSKNTNFNTDESAWAVSMKICQQSLILLNKVIIIGIYLNIWNVCVTIQYTDTLRREEGF